MVTETERIRRRSYYLANREKCLAKCREYRAREKEKLRERDHLRYQVNKERHAKWARDYVKANPERRRANLAARRAVKEKATPSWVERDKLLRFYAEAVRLSEETGIPHEVDHIVPLRSKIVCGLHCESNLQVIPAAENRKKLNTYWPDMPDP